MTKKANQGNWVDIHDANLMIQLGMHPCFLKPKDSSVWTKTDSEKKRLKVLRKRFKGSMHFHSVPTRPIPVRAKLIIQLKKNKKFPNTTYSTICNMHQISEVLSTFCQEDPTTHIMENVVAKYSYNGKTYSPSELPFWGMVSL